MGYINFLKENEPSQKKDYIPASQKVHKFRKRWKIAFIISGVVNVLCIGFIIFKFIYKH